MQFIHVYSSAEANTFLLCGSLKHSKNRFWRKVALKDSFGKMPFESLGHFVGNVHLYKDLARRPNLLEPARLSMDHWYCL